MEHFTPLSSAVGGALIGLASALVLMIQGRIAGISGIVGTLFQPSGEGRAWKATFLAGLLVGGFAVFQHQPQWFDVSGVPSTMSLIAAGLLVGVGTQLGSGCTSGHGVCGISRWSPRSLIATGTFTVVGGITVYVTRHLVQGGV